MIKAYSAIRFFAKQENDQSINYFFISYWRILPESKIMCNIEAKDDLNTDSLKDITNLTINNFSKAGTCALFPNLIYISHLTLIKLF